MKILRFQKTAKAPVHRQRLWDWHMSPGAFERLSPEWQRLIPLNIPDSPREGATAEFALKNGPLKLKWLARIGPVESPYRFVDTQEKGPFASWKHEHKMDESASNESMLTDVVTFSLPWGLGSIPFARKRALAELERLFRFRHDRMLMDLKRFPDSLQGSGLSVLVSGSSGLVGKRLVPYLRTLGYEVRELSRRGGKKGIYSWDPDSGRIDAGALDGVDAVIHLAGENIAGGRWTAERKKRIMDSRVNGTRTLVQAIEASTTPPSVLVCASGVNYYAMGPGSHGEADPMGEGFLAEVCANWEAEAMRARTTGTRVVCMRTGIVLDPLGGALGKMLPAFLAGMGGPIGSGKQGFSWIAMDDLLDLYEWSIWNPHLDGPLNAVHPEPVSQRTFSRVLASVLHRPSAIPLPESAVKLLFGQMGTETLLADLTVLPVKALELGHQFRFENLQDALSFMLGKERK